MRHLGIDNETFLSYIRNQEPVPREVLLKIVDFTKADTIENFLRRER
jgi:hypothetical protein